MFEWLLAATRTNLSTAYVLALAFQRAINFLKETIPRESDRKNPERNSTASIKKGNKR